METSKRRDLASEVLDGYVSGPEAGTEATAQALARAVEARATILVEGVSDQMAVEALAVRRGRDLGADGTVVMPVGGAQGMGRFIAQFGPSGRGLVLAGLCDDAEEESVKRSLTKNGVKARTRRDLEDAGFFVCVEDLEDELIRAAGTPRVEALLNSQGGLGSFRTMQSQPAWRNQAVDAQLRRFLGAGARRKLRYARLLVNSIELERMPRPLDEALNAV